MFTKNEKILLITGTIFFVLATLGVYYFFKSFEEDLHFKSSSNSINSIKEQLEI